jgi:hypothetical protein
LHLNPGDEFCFICLPDQVVKMAKVINFRQGYVIEKQKKTDGIIITVGKKAPLS